MSSGSINVSPDGHVSKVISEAEQQLEEITKQLQELVHNKETRQNVVYQQLKQSLADHNRKHQSDADDQQKASHKVRCLGDFFKHITRAYFNSIQAEYMPKNIIINYKMIDEYFIHCNDMLQEFIKSDENDNSLLYEIYDILVEIFNYKCINNKAVTEYNNLRDAKDINLFLETNHHILNDTFTKQCYFDDIRNICTKLNQVFIIISMFQHLKSVLAKRLSYNEVKEITDFLVKIIGKPETLQPVLDNFDNLRAFTEDEHTAFNEQIAHLIKKEETPFIEWNDFHDIIGFDISHPGVPDIYYIDVVDKFLNYFKLKVEKYYLLILYNIKCLNKIEMLLQKESKQIYIWSYSEDDFDQMIEQKIQLSIKCDTGYNKFIETVCKEIDQLLDVQSL
jgi:hypothetical protein